MTEVLLVGAAKSQTASLASILRQDRHVVHVLRDVERWHEAESAREMDLIVAAIDPSERLFPPGSPRAAGFPTPILVVAQGPDQPMLTHRDDRLIDRIAAPFEAQDLVARVDALIRVKGAVRRAAAESGGRDLVVGPHAASGGLLINFGTRLGSLLGSRVPRFARPYASYVGVAGRVASWADRRDAFEPGHAERVATFAALIANGLGLDEEEIATTMRAARLHDIGKVALPVQLLRQRGPLADDQKRLIQTHPARGAMILSALNTDASIVEAIRHHHARFDGKKVGQSGRHGVPRLARILAVAEVYDAMTSTMVAPALKRDVALDRIRGLRGGQLDPNCVDALIDALRPRSAKLRTALCPS